MPFRILRVASLALFVTLVQCKHVASTVEKCEPSADPGPGPVPLCWEQLHDVVNRGSYVLISADRNSRCDPTEMTDGELLDRTCELAANLRSMGFTYAVARGHYGDDEGETSFLVLAEKSEHLKLICLGKNNNQDSIIIGDAGKHTLLFTTGTYKGKAYTIDAQVSGRKENPNQHTDIRDKMGARFTFSLGFDKNFDFGNYEPLFKDSPPSVYEDATKAFATCPEVPKALDSSPSCAAR